MSTDKITPDDQLSRSKDLIQENINQLKKLFPEIVSESKIDFKTLQQVLGEEIEDEEEFYRFTWAGKSQARREAHKPSTGTLRPCKEESLDWDTTQNLYIEGDNLEVLKLLQKSYSGKIKMIYIDPPYNTGNDFVYKDNYKDNLKNYQEITGQIDSEGIKISTNSESDGRFHSNWLNMMYPRLRLSRNLLKEDGVIFISIDDNEVDNLKKVCDDVFGEINYNGTFVVKSTPNARDYGHIGKTHEYCVFYSKNKDLTQTFHLPDNEKTFKYQDHLGEYNIHPLYNSNENFHKENRPNLYYPFYLNLKGKLFENDFYEIGLEKTEDSIEIYPPKSLKNGVQFVWRWGKEKSKENLNQEIVGYKVSENEYRIVQKMRTSEKVIRSLLDGKDVTSRKGTAEVESLFNSKVFSFPKPIGLLKNFILASLDENDIMLDFFSGSSSSAHAILDLNMSDNKKRKFIQIQLPEDLNKNDTAYSLGYKTISDIGKERIRKVISNIKSEKSSSFEQMDLGFKVFKLDSSNIKSWDGNPENLESSLFDSISNIKSDRAEEDVLYEILLKYGLDLTLPIEERDIHSKKVFNVGMGSLFICLGDDITSKVAEGIGEWKEECDPEVCRVIFKDNGFSDVEKTNSVQILKRFGINEIKSI